MEVAKEKALMAEAEIVVVELFEKARLPEKVVSPDIVPAVREVAERELVEREVNPEAAPAEVIFQAEEVISAVLMSCPKVILPEAERFPPVEMPEEKSPNDAETPEPDCGGEPPPACWGPGIWVVRKTTGFWTWLEGKRFSSWDNESWIWASMAWLSEESFWSRFWGEASLDSKEARRMRILLTTPSPPCPCKGGDSGVVSPLLNKEGVGGGVEVASPKVIILLPSFSKSGGGVSVTSVDFKDKKSWAMILMSLPKETR